MRRVRLALAFSGRRRSRGFGDCGRSRHRDRSFDERNAPAAARLNLADCAAYALAVTMNAPLLFKAMMFRRQTCGCEED